MPASPTDLVTFVESAVDLQQGSETELGVLIAAYRQWCAKMNRGVLGDDVVLAGLQRFCSVGGITQRRQRGKVYLQNVVLLKGAT
jgi:hypothetical protein